MAEQQDDQGGTRRRGELSRRAFLTVSGGGVAGYLWDAQLDRELGTLLRIAKPSKDDRAEIDGDPGATLVTRTVRRPVDQLQLQFTFVNWKMIRVGGHSTLRRQRASAPVIVRFPPQAFGEQVYRPVSDNVLVPRPGDRSARLAEPSRLVFDVPEALGDLPADDTAALLDWRQWQLRVVPNARQVRPQAPYADPRAPGIVETSLELPWFLVLSPSERATFVASGSPVIDEGRVEAWHARMATRLFSFQGQDPKLSERPGTLHTVRAVWARDPEIAAYIDDPSKAPVDRTTPDGEFKPAGQGLPFEMSMTPNDRARLVAQTSGYGRTSQLPQAVPVSSLSLGALGGSLDVGVRFTDPDHGLQAWRHRMNLGRDHHVRIVDLGFLAPWGFPVAEVRVAERSVKSSSGGFGPTATLLQRKYLIVRDPEVRYAGAGPSSTEIGVPSGGRRLPFRSARLTTLVTPDLRIGSAPLGNSGAQHVELADGSPAIFNLVATDAAGNEVDISMPMVFVPSSTNKSASRSASLRTAWAQQLPTIDTRGQRVAFADEAVRDTCTLPTEAVTLLLVNATNAAFVPDGQVGPGPDHQNLAPVLASADVGLDAVRSVGGGNDSSTTRIAFTSDYLAGGFRGGEVWARVLSGAAALDFATDRSGGMLAPNIGITGLSRKLGPVAGSLGELDAGRFDPQQWFEGSGTMLGGIALGDVIQAVTGLGDVGSSAPDTVPALRTVRTADGLEHRFEWHPRLRPDRESNGKVIGVFEPMGAKTADVVAVVRLRSDGGSPETEVRAELGPVMLHLPSKPNRLVSVPFRRLAFDSRSGQRPDIDVDIDAAGIEFGGALDFVRGLRQYLAFGGGSGPTVEVTDRAIAVSVGAQLPDIKLGVFSLYDLSFSGGVELPLDGSAALIRLALGTQSNPFHLTVFGIGGGGFLELALAADGLRRLTLGLEAVAEAVLDFGLFSAGIGCSFGCIINLVANDDDVELGFIAYFRMYGEIDLAIASASISLYLGLDYRDGDLYGRATLVVEVSVLFFSESVEIEFERRFNSCDNDPPFAELLSAEQWRDDYCAAFAPLNTVGAH